MRILITRPIEEARLLQKDLEELSYKTLVVPFSRIEYVERINYSDLSKFDQFIITSRNALKAIKLLDKNIRLLIVGEDSTSYAQTLGFKNASFGGLNVEELKNNLNEKSKYLYFSGSEVTEDFSSFANVERRIVYNTRMIDKFPTELIEFIKNKEQKIVMLFSTNTTKLFVDFIKSEKLNKFCENIIVLTLSDKIANNLNYEDFKKIYISENPNLKSILKKLQEIEHA